MLLATEVASDPLVDVLRRHRRTARKCPPQLDRLAQPGASSVQ